MRYDSLGRANLWSRAESGTRVMRITFKLAKTELNMLNSDNGSNKDSSKECKHTALDWRLQDEWGVRPFHESSEYASGVWCGLSEGYPRWQLDAWEAINSVGLRLLLVKPRERCGNVTNLDSPEVPRQRTNEYSNLKDCIQKDTSGGIQSEVAHGRHRN
jgi:hypothetical protein